MDDFGYELFEQCAKDEGIEDSSDYEAEGFIAALVIFGESAAEWLTERGVNVDLLEEDGHVLCPIAYHTVTGAGVGLWEDEWAQYFPAGKQRELCDGLRDALCDSVEIALANAMHDAVASGPPCPAAVTVNGDGCDIEEPFEDTTAQVVLNEEGAHPRGGKLGWCNSASVRTDVEGDSVTVAISVGSPFGAFAMRVTRVNGELFLDVPDPSDGFPHMPLTAMRSGRFKVG